MTDVNLIYRRPVTLGSGAHVIAGTDLDLSVTVGSPPPPTVNRIFTFDFGDVSKTAYDAWYNSILPINSTTGRPRPGNNNYDLTLGDGNKIGAFINYEVPTMDANGKIRAKMYSPFHDKHNLLGIQIPGSSLMSWRYFLPGNNLRFKFGITLDTTTYTDSQWKNDLPWNLFFELHPGTWGGSWVDASKSPPISVGVVNGEFVLGVRGSTQTVPKTFTQNRSYPWPLVTGYHDFQLDVHIDYTGVNSLTRLSMDGDVKHTITHENGINGGALGDGSEYMAIGNYSGTSGPEVLIDYLYVEDF